MHIRSFWLGLMLKIPRRSEGSETANLVYVIKLLSIAIVVLAAVLAFVLGASALVSSVLQAV